MHSSYIQPRNKIFLTFSLAATLAFLSGCSVAPKELTRDELNLTNQLDRIEARKNMPAIKAPLTLEGAIARALKYNLDHRTKLLEQALAAGQFEAGKFDMLPKLLADAGYSWRDKNLTREATDSVTGLPSLSNPYISSEKEHTTTSLGLSWNLLDFGASYYSAKQNGNRILVASERRRKAMHTLIQSVRTAYWRTLAAQRLSGQVHNAIHLAEGALARSRTVSDESIKNPSEALRYQRNLLENIRLLENVDRELAMARIELASLIGVDPNAKFSLKDSGTSTPGALRMKISDMEDMALKNNADLREQHYNVRIVADETRKSILRLLPGIHLDFSGKHDNDKYLINNSWEEAGVRVSFNLFNLLAAPSVSRAGKMAEAVAEVKRMALQMSVLTQVHLARYQYIDSLRQYNRASTIYNVDYRLAQLVRAQAETETVGDLERISTQVSAILSDVRRYHALAKLHESASKLQATLGLEPKIDSLDSMGLDELSRRVAESLRAWGTAQPKKA
jgi:outer membrane protein TolC